MIHVMGPAFTKITESEFGRLCEEGLRSALRHYGWLVARDADGRVIKSGTATCFSIEDNRFLLTAEHVVEGLLESGGPTFLLAFTRSRVAMATHGTIMRPEDFPIDLGPPATVVRLPELDVAVLKPPRNILSSESIRWFDGVAQERAAAAMRQAHEERGGIIQLIVVGFPNLARLEVPEQRLQLAANRPVLTTLRSIDAPSVGAVQRRRPQMILEVDVDELRSLPMGAGEFEEGFQANVSRGEGKDVPLLGGCSGGPVLLCSTEGTYVVALVVQGDLDQGARIFATPIDEILHALRRSSLFRTLRSEASSGRRGRRS